MAIGSACQLFFAANDARYRDTAAYVRVAVAERWEELVVGAGTDITGIARTLYCGPQGFLKTESLFSPLV